MEKRIQFNILLLMCMLIGPLGISQTFELYNNTSNGNVKYETTNSGSNAAEFIIFGDGFFSINEQGWHQYPPSSAGFNATAHINPDYKLTPPTKLTKHTGGTGAGGGAVNKVGNVNFTKVATSWYPCLNIENYFILVIENDNTIPQNGTAQFYYDSSQLNLPSTGILTYTNVNLGQISSYTGSALYDTKIEFSFTNLAPNEQRIVYIPMTSIVPTGTNLRIGSSYNISEHEIFIFNQVIKTAGFPHDPNSKTVFPTILQPYTKKAQNLTYTIRFQNEGDAEASHVTLIDFLDFDYLDTYTLNIIESEYPYEHYINHATGELTIEFPNINLPGLKQTEPYTYSYDETESYIVFEICTHQMEFDKQCIYNKVDILFDTQPPITTNTAETCAIEREDYQLVKFCDEDMNKTSNQNENLIESQIKSIKSSHFKEEQISIYPNPIIDQITLSGIESEGSEIYLLNSMGQLIASSTSNGSGNDILQFKDIPNGLYFLLYESNGERVIKKIVK